MVKTRRIHLMKSLYVAATAVLWMAPGAAAFAEEPATPPVAAATVAKPITDPKAQVSYALGQNLGENLRRDGVDVDPAMLAQGVKDALAGAQSRLTDEQRKAVFEKLQTVVSEHRKKAAEEATASVKSEGAAFLKANAAKPGVVTLPSGLEYQILKAGAGVKPKLGDRVIVNYRGTLLNGTEFDSSYKRGSAATFYVKDMIKGWIEALQLMPVGSQWRLWIPPELAYGEKGAHEVIGPNAVLVFEIELVGVEAVK
jgi:FKBP-type peptidyl-prolyl cis-trans isomerase FklB